METDLNWQAFQGDFLLLYVGIAAIAVLASVAWSLDMKQRHKIIFTVFCASALLWLPFARRDMVREMIQNYGYRLIIDEAYPLPLVHSFVEADPEEHLNKPFIYCFYVDEENKLICLSWQRNLLGFLPKSLDEIQFLTE